MFPKIAIKYAIDAINKHLFKNEIKKFHPKVEEIINLPSKVTPLGPNEDREHRKWLLKKQWEKNSHIEFKNDIRNWTDDDMRSAMMQKDYPKNSKLKAQVAAYFKKKYPNKVTYS